MSGLGGRGGSVSKSVSLLFGGGGEGGGRTSRAAVGDSSHRSRRNSSRAMDSLSTLMMRWQSWGRKNSMSS